MKITDVIVSMLFKKGVLCESQNVDMEIDIPKSALKIDEVDKSDKITIRFKAENVKITVEKGE